MNAVAYCHPFVPPEWIACAWAAALLAAVPGWGDEPAVRVRRGACPVAAGRLDDFSGSCRWAPCRAPGTPGRGWR